MTRDQQRETSSLGLPEQTVRASPAAQQNEESKTVVIREAQKILSTALKFLQNANSRIDIVSAQLSRTPPEGTEKLAEAFLSILQRGGKIRLISNITSENLEYCKELMRVFEIRHLDSIPGNFAVSEREYAAIPGAKEFSPKGTLLYSNMPEVVEQNSFVFEVLWNKAVPADLRVQTLEGGEALGETRFTFSTKEIFESANRNVEEMKEEAIIIVPRKGGIKDNLDFFTKVVSRGTQVGASIRILAQFSSEEIPFIRKFQNGGVQVKMLKPSQRLNIALGIYDRKNMGLVQYIDPENPNPKLETYISGFISNNKQMVGWVGSIFDMLWENAFSAEEEMARLEKGIEPPVLQVIHDPQVVQDLFLDLLQQSQSEILLLFPTVNAFNREERLGTVALLVEASKRGVKIKAIVPVNSPVEETLRLIESEIGQEAAERQISFKVVAGFRSPGTVTVVIVDRNSSLVIEQKDDTQMTFAGAIGASTYASRNATVSANFRFFERMWDEIELREREEALLKNEERSRRSAELMQDILTHDMRNFNQIIGLNAELLKIESSDETQTSKLESILRAVDGETKLIENAKKLGKISEDSSTSLVPMEVKGAIERSLSLLRRAYPEKTLEVSITNDGSSKNAMVLADEFLPEAFTNVVSNCIRYTDGIRVPIEISIERQTGLDEADTKHSRHGNSNSNKTAYWKISISDRGKGIDDQSKKSAFMRYRESSTGSGLGLSIVHALVVERYSGRAMVKNRVKDDYTGGTTLELWLPVAQ